MVTATVPVTTSPFRSLCYNLVRIHRHHGWIGWSVAFLLWKSARYVLEPWKLVLSEEAFKSVQGQRSLDLGSEEHGVFNNNDLSSACLGQPRTTAVVYKVCESLGDD